MDPFENLAEVTASPNLLSPGGKSRYGRTRRPKISQDFYNIDDVVIDDKRLLKAPTLKSPKYKTAVKSPVLVKEEEFEFQDEFTKLDDLGMKVANNFKTNLQRGLDDSIKERKFFKTLPEARQEVPVDVTKVFKLISTKSADLFESKPSKSALKTYTNKRKHIHESDSFIVESFGLPDEPIVPLRSPLIERDRDINIDVGLNCENDVNLPKPWIFDDLEPIPLYASDAMDQLGCRGNMIDSPSGTPFGEAVSPSCQSASFERLTVPTMQTCHQTSLTESWNMNNSLIKKKKPAKKKDRSQRKTTKNENLANGELLKMDNPSKNIDVIEVNVLPDKTEETGTESHVEAEIKFDVNLLESVEECVIQVENKQDSNIDKNTPSRKRRKWPVVPKRELRSNTDLLSSSIESLLISPVKRVKSKKSVSKAVKLVNNGSKKVINPVRLSQKICNPELRVILNPMSCLDKILEKQSFVRNPYKKGRPSKRKTKYISQKSKDLIQLEQGELKQNAQNEEQTVIKIEDDEEITNDQVHFEIGDLAWAKIGKHPYWPCMITQDPFTGEHKKYLVNRIQPQYHVRFFGDKGRRSWVNGQNIMLYYERDDLEKLANVLKAEDKIRASIISESYIVRGGQLEKWQKGVDEAEKLKYVTVEQRLDYFFKVISGQEEIDARMKEIDVKSEDGDNKKRKPLSDNEIITKRIKLETEATLQDEYEEVDIKEKIEENARQSLERRTLRSSFPKAAEKFENNLNCVEKNIKSETETSSNNGSFTERCKQHSKNVTEEETKLRNKNPPESLKGSPSLPKTEQTSEKSRNKRNPVLGECSNSDTDSKFSDNSSVPASLESQAALVKRNNIFKGVSREKVCQICEEPRGVFKCKGPCSGMYHKECIIKQVSAKIEKKEKIRMNGGVEKMEREKQESRRSNVEIISINSKRPLPNLTDSPNDKGMTLSEKIDLRMKEIMKKFDHSLYHYESTDSSNEDVIVNETDKEKNEWQLSMDVAEKSTIKEIPIIKHVTADNVSYLCITDERQEETDIEDVIKSDLQDGKCYFCAVEENPLCFVCGKEDPTVRQKCAVVKCGRFYHPECLKAWPQTQWSLIQNRKSKNTGCDTFVCPRHVCHTCISDDPRASNSRCPSDKVVKCLRCPATYHSSSYCVPAGSHILSSSQIVCPRHFSRNVRKILTINTNWCFICSKGGNLICCETCPTSVHVECLPGARIEDDKFFCEDCQSGRLPLYDEIVWVKLGSFRWWPALILFPNEVPENVRNKAHNRGEFVVKFFGTYDHYWVGRGRTFLFQEGDKGHSCSIRKRVDSAFVKAIAESAAAHQLKKQFKLNKVAQQINTLKPPPYIRIKINRPVGNVRLFDGNTSNTTSCECDPNQPYPCGPDSDCLNRLLLTECNPDMCPAGPRCNNQNFEKREYPPLTPYRTEVRGWGLKTLAPIRKGQFVIEYVGEVIDEQEYQRRVKKMHEQKEENYYFLTIDKDRTLDAGPKGNVARFMNHSCQPNCETQKWTVNGDTRVGLFAACDIQADTELTFNYNLECIGKEKKICSCGASNCSGYIGVKVKPDAPKKPPKPKKKKIAPVVVVDNENPCFVCGQSGDVGACNNKMCTKFYHLRCVAMSSWPEGGKWVCQWHNCNLCSKRTIRCCVKCLNSYCPSHSEGNVRYDRLLGFVCFEHDPTKEVTEVTKVPKVVSAEVTDEAAVTSTTSECEPNINDFDSASLRDRLNGIMTSTPLKKTKDFSQVESSSGGKRKQKRNKRKGESVFDNTATLFKTDELSPVRSLRSRTIVNLNLNNSHPEKQKSVQKRRRLRCEHTL